MSSTRHVFSALEDRCDWENWEVERVGGFQ
jgi:hypothetical protein